MNGRLWVAEPLLVAVSVAVEEPTVVGVPLITPELAIVTPGGRPVALKVGA